ncbi:MAG: class I SAM-dependent methyltransferase [Terracidiphilus sp.]
MMRSEDCPLCELKTESVLQLRFNTKMHLPTRAEIRHCQRDNFLFVASGSQKEYDEYYKSLANDSVHAELARGSLHSPISEVQRDRLVSALGGFFDQPRRVLDFGCGEASLLVELAGDFPSSTFLGFDPSPGAQIGLNKAKALGLSNLFIADLEASTARGPCDLVIVSHVMEHLLDFDLLKLLNRTLAENGLLYIEVPNSLLYESYGREEFLYYFDRLHVNHFTPESLVRLAARYGFGYLRHIEYTFPYRDGGEYPALGVLFEKAREPVGIASPRIIEASRRYVSQEQKRASEVARQFKVFEGILVWGAGDNFFRSIENGGPLSGLPNMVLLDRRSLEITIGDRIYATEEPTKGIRHYPWPVVITVSEGRRSISEQVSRIDSGRHVFFV